MIKQLKVLGLLLAMVMVIVGFSSCESNVNAPQDEQQTVQGESVLSLQSELTAIRLSQDLGTISVSPQEGVAQETDFSFSFTSYNSMITERIVDLYVVFYPPLGGEFPKKLAKTVYGGTTIGTLSMELQQAGTYRFRAGFSVDDGKTVVPFGENYYIVVSSKVIPLGDDYPWKGESSRADDYGLIRGWCTSWVAWKINQMWGSNSTFFNTMYGSSETNKLGDAAHWKSVLERNGYLSDLSPQVGDIAWWGSNHVAFVNEVIDANTVRITEYNNPSVGKKNAYHTRELYRNGPKGHKFPDAFIHVQRKL